MSSSRKIHKFIFKTRGPQALTVTWMSIREYIHWLLVRRAYICIWTSFKIHFFKKPCTYWIDHMTPATIINRTTREAMEIPRISAGIKSEKTNYSVLFKMELISNSHSCVNWPGKSMGSELLTSLRVLWFLHVLKTYSSWLAGRGTFLLELMSYSVGR